MFPGDDRLAMVSEEISEIFLSPHPPVAVVILAGGGARRLGGGDKGLRPLAGGDLLSRIVAALRPQAAALALNANGVGDRFAAWGLPVLADPPGAAGPLAGLLAGLDWAAAAGFPWLLTVPTDTPFLPADLVIRLGAGLRGGAGLAAIAASAGRRHPVIGLWSTGLAAPLRRFLVERGERQARLWAEEAGAAAVAWSDWPVDPFFNVNSPGDLRQAEDLAGQPVCRPGAVLLPPGRSAQGLLTEMAAAAQSRGLALGGLLQRGGKSEGSGAGEITMLALDSGEGFPLMQKLGGDACCAIDTQVMAEASQALRRAIARRDDLVLVNKFGPLEAEGRGLADDMRAVMAEELPLLTTVSVRRLEAWLDFTGGCCEVLPADGAALWRWWERNRAAA